MGTNFMDVLIKKADLIKPSKIRSRNIVVTAFLSFMMLGNAGSARADIVLSGDVVAGTGVLSLTTDYSFSITLDSNIAVLVFEGWGFPPDAADNGVSGTNAIKVEINGIDAEILRLQLHDNFPIDVADFSAGDSYWFMAPKPSVSVGDVVTIRGGSSPLTINPFWNPVVSGTFTGNLFLANADGIRISDIVSAIPAPTAVTIDIKPGSDPNCFNINGHGVIPVAILGSDSFDVTKIVQDSLSFGGLEVRVRGNKGPLCHVDYSNGDQYLDLVCQFEDNSDFWNPGDGEATLTGSLVDGGGDFEGADSICVVP